MNNHPKIFTFRGSTHPVFLVPLFKEPGDSISLRNTFGCVKDLSPYGDSDLISSMETCTWF
eukprot:snap_masked-scaffold_55-processed-gene-1.15-mRNA-1 protein AED:1.00 eAED:1.00 QI:0/0/0/0/1/1/2/0/60